MQRKMNFTNHLNKIYQNKMKINIPFPDEFITLCLLLAFDMQYSDFVAFSI